MNREDPNNTGETPEPPATGGQPRIVVTPSGLVAQSIILIAIAFLIVAITDRVSGHAYLTQILATLTPNPRFILLGAALGFPFFIFGEGMWWLRKKLGFQGESSEDFMEHGSVAGSVVSSIASGFPEELLFRGVIQTLGGLWVASALFACMHWTGKRSLPYVLCTFVYGCILGAAYIYFGNLWVGIMMHVINNFLTFTASERFRSWLPA